ncbi:hypothetical protein RRG08_008529 [Elysia crispata]|uniref:Transposase n=1 Tax=Elysia crispata TaxID=231223 RepID=A0AAE1DW54_9GAST|nr:hypothetical protein RRG08_008529 [Elysia crispata]
MKQPLFQLSQGRPLSCKTNIFKTPCLSPEFPQSSDKWIWLQSVLAQQTRVLISLMYHLNANKDEQKDSRVNFSRNFLRRFQAEQNDFLGRIITGDETWVYSWDPETKRQSAEWRDFDEPRPEKVRRKQGALKVMHMIFFDMNGVILRWPIPIGTTINAQYYKKVLARQTQTCHSKETTRAVGVRHLVSPRQCASPYGPGSDRRFDWLQVGTAGASSLFT